MPAKIQAVICIAIMLLGIACKQPTTAVTATDIPFNKEVETHLDNRISYFIKLYGSKEKLEQVSGKTIAQLKEEYRPLIAEQIEAEKHSH